MLTLVLTVTRSRNPDGLPAASTRGLLFDGTVDDRKIVRRSTQPLLDACRALQAEGVDLATPIVMRHAISGIDALRTTVGVAAGLMIREGDRAPVFGPWKPHFHALDGSPSDFSEEAATMVAPDAESAPRSEFGG